MTVSKLCCCLADVDALLGLLLLAAADGRPPHGALLLLLLLAGLLLAGALLLAAAGCGSSKETEERVSCGACRCSGVCKQEAARALNKRRFVLVDIRCLPTTASLACDKCCRHSLAAKHDSTCNYLWLWLRWKQAVKS